MFFIGFFVGVTIWQSAVLLFNLFWGADENKFIVASTGLVGGIVITIHNVLTIIKKIINTQKYAAALVDKEGRACYCRPCDATDYISDGDYAFNNEFRQRHKIADGWRKKDCVLPNVPNLRYSPIALMKKEGFYKLPKYKKFSKTS